MGMHLNLFLMYTNKQWGRDQAYTIKWTWLSKRFRPSTNNMLSAFAALQSNFTTDSYPWSKQSLLVIWLWYNWLWCCLHFSYSRKGSGLWNWVASTKHGCLMATIYIFIGNLSQKIIWKNNITVLIWSAGFTEPFSCTFPIFTCQSTLLGGL